MIRILLVEDVEILRNTYARLIDGTEGFCCVAALSNAINILQAIYQHRADVILMDINMPGKDGIAAVREIRNAGIQIPIVMQTIFDEDDKVFPAILAGANGYILKNTAEEQLINVIQEAADGGGPMTPSIATKVLKYLRSNLPMKDAKTEPAAAEQIASFTNRQKEILELLMDGASYKMIADELSISIETVRFHIKKIYAALHIHSRAELMKRT